jgi:hypothetical protein
MAVVIAGAGWAFHKAPRTTAWVALIILVAGVISIYYFQVTPLTCLAFALASLAINLPAFAVMAGGLIEGFVAESGFDQYWHFVTFWFMHLSLAAYVVLYLWLVRSNEVHTWLIGFAVYFTLYLAAIVAVPVRKFFTRR